MSRKILNQGLPEAEGTWDRTQRTAWDAALDRADANFAEVYAGSGTAFNNAGTSLTSTTVQDAIVELSAKIDAINAALT